MKNKRICSVIIIFAALTTGAQAIGQEIPSEGFSPGTVARNYTGKSAKPFLNSFIAKLQQTAKSGDAIMGKGTAKYVAELQAGNYYGYIHQTTRALAEKELQTGIRPENSHGQPEIAGQTTIDQTCQKNADNTATVVGVTYVAEADSKGTLAWTIKRFITSLKATCPDTAI